MSLTSVLLYMQLQSQCHCLQGRCEGCSPSGNIEGTRQLWQDRPFIGHRRMKMYVWWRVAKKKTKRRHPDSGMHQTARGKPYKSAKFISSVLKIHSKHSRKRLWQMDWKSVHLFLSNRYVLISIIRYYFRQLVSLEQLSEVVLPPKQTNTFSTQFQTRHQHIISSAEKVFFFQF